MVKIIMHGCNGHMGQVISGIVEKDPDAEIVAGIDIADQGKNSYPVFTDIDACQVEADAIIDFSSAKATDKLLEYSAARQIPVVLCSTGLSQEQLAKVLDGLAERERRVITLRFGLGGREEKTQKEGADLLFQLVNRRYALMRSTIVTTNVPVGRWGDVFGSNVTASAVADRLCHRCAMIKITGRSYRLKDVSIGGGDGKEEGA